MIEFYKYLYAGGFALGTPYRYQKISQKLESQANVSSCPANFTPVCWLAIRSRETLYAYERNDAIFLNFSTLKSYQNTDLKILK